METITIKTLFIAIAFAIAASVSAQYNFNTSISGNLTGNALRIQTTFGNLDLCY